MSTSPDAVATLDRLLDEDPYQPGIDAMMTVAGDLLQARGHRRGELIVLEQALAAADRRARNDRAAELHRWLLEHQTSVLGQAFASFSSKRGALRYSLRGGRLRGLFVDLRRVEHEGFEIAQVITALLGSHGARRLVELRVRGRSRDQLAQVVAGIEHLSRRPPLELVSASTTTRPDGHLVDGDAAPLRELLPNLWFATHAGEIARIYARELDDEETAAALRGFAGAPMSRELRIHIGRALTSGREQTTIAGCELIATLGESARVFAPVLRTLLQPKVSPAIRWLLPALPSFGAWALELWPAVARITGATTHYPAAVRSLAGCCLHGLARSSPSVDLLAKPSQAPAS